MAQLFWRHGVMNCGKSSALLQVAHNYEEIGRNVLLVTASVADRDGVGIIKSRALDERRVADILVYVETDLEVEIAQRIVTKGKVDCILVDEAQFLTTAQVVQLRQIVNYMGVPVICYGLRIDSNYELFDGSKALFQYADKIEDIMKTICAYCEKKATAILRFDGEGIPIYGGEQIQVGGNETYKSVCSKHWFEGGDTGHGLLDN